MNIYEYADAINKEIIIRRYPNQNNRFLVEFDHSETKDNKFSCTLSGTYGNGECPREAINDYIEGIQGKILVFNAMSDNRQEFVVPHLDKL